MIVPTLEKTWTFIVNNSIAFGSSFLNSSRAQIHAIKTALKAAGWTVVGSSDGTVGHATMDGTDWLTAATDWAWPVSGSVPSVAAGWIVLKQTAIASNFQLLIYTGQTTGTAGTNGYISVSPSAGFTLAGTPTFKPTATDEVAVRANSGIVGAGSTTTIPYNSVMHLMYSSDSTCWRIVCHNGGIDKLSVIIDTVADPVTGWSPAFAASWIGNTTATMHTYALYNDVATYLLSRINGTNVNLYMTTEGFIDGMLGEKCSNIPNAFDNLWPICPIGLASLTSARTGRHGRLQDIYFGASSDTLIEGSTFPNDGTRRFICVGQMVFPWDGSYPVIA